MKFTIAYLKLTGFYILIVMIISVAFSIAIYRISSTELGRGLVRQSRFLREMPNNDNEFQPPDDFERIRNEQLNESSHRLEVNLIYFNLLILILASVASYFFARRTLRPIENSMEAQNRFTADASHELRTPLTAIRTEIEVNLRDKKLNLSEAKNLLKSNLEEIGKLETLSGALLKIARYQDGPKGSFEKVSLEEVLVESYEKVQSLAEKESIKFENDFQNLYINGDKEALVELFVVLLDNAIKYSPKRSKVFIDIAKDKHMAKVKIKDKGIGIKASDLPHIFDRFYRADSSRCKEQVQGYGLGLSLAKQIVELHNGKITATSRPGKGSEFVVSFTLLKS
jgi:signal transduction histidine kinase